MPQNQPIVNKNLPSLTRSNVLLTINRLSKSQQLDQDNLAVKLLGHSVLCISHIWLQKQEDDTVTKGESYLYRRVTQWVRTVYRIPAFTVRKS